MHFQELVSSTKVYHRKLIATAVLHWFRMTLHMFIGGLLSGNVFATLWSRLYPSILLGRCRQKPSMSKLNQIFCSGGFMARRIMQLSVSLSTTTCNLQMASMTWVHFALDISLDACCLQCFSVDFHRSLFFQPTWIRTFAGLTSYIAWLWYCMFLDLQSWCEFSWYAFIFLENWFTRVLEPFIGFTWLFWRTDLQRYIEAVPAPRKMSRIVGKNFFTMTVMLAWWMWWFRFLLCLPGLSELFVCFPG